jgi:hypothetical protein
MGEVSELAQVRYRDDLAYVPFGWKTDLSGSHLIWLRGYGLALFVMINTNRII